MTEVMTEVMTEEKNQFEVMVIDANLPVAKAEHILGQFKEFFNIAAQWEKKAMAIVVTDESQTDIMKEARTARLILKDKRVKINNTKKELKAHLISEGKAIQGMANILSGIIEPLEKHLQEQEDFIKIRQAKAEAERLEKARIALEEKEAAEAAQKAEEEAAAAAEQKKIRDENRRLKKEAADAEKARIEAEKKRRVEVEESHKELDKVKATFKATIAEQKETEAKLETSVKANTQAKEAIKKLAFDEIQCPKCKHIFNR